MKPETKAGLFVLIGFFSLLLLTFQIKSLERLKEKGYVLYAIVNDASGLNKRSRVKFRGIKIGIVDGMKLENNGVKLKLIINTNIKIPLNSKVTLAQDNMLGGKYLKIIPSKEKEFYKPYQTIVSYLQTASLDDVMNNVNDAIKDIRILLFKINNILDENTSQNIKLTVSNIKESSVKLKSIVSIIDTKLPLLLDNANRLILSYKKSGDILSNKLPLILEKVNKLSLNANDLITDSRDFVSKLKVKITKLSDTYTKLGENVNSLVVDNNETIKTALSSASDFFENGSNSFKKIDDFLSQVNKTNIAVDISSNYLFKDKSYLTQANIKYIPSPTKYYLIGVVSRKDYSNNIKSDKEKIFINAEIAKRYDNLILRGGIIESTGGVGLDYFLNNDKIKLSSSVYDFNSENDKRGKSAHISVDATYYYLKHLEFIAGVDNILNKDARSFFLGVGVKFRDNDLKPIISGGATSFLK